MIVTKKIWEWPTEGMEKRKASGLLKGVIKTRKKKEKMERKKCGKP